MAAAAVLRSVASKIARASPLLYPRPGLALQGQTSSSRLFSNSFSSPCAGSTPPPPPNNNKANLIRDSTNAAFFLLYGGLIVFAWVKLSSDRSDAAAASRGSLKLEQDLTQTTKDCHRINAVLDTSSVGKKSMQASGVYT
ncbi:hypothetical protein PR202_ga13538 [Eleusine coracana subsp. coracana]|uniref:Uncharacterized protein n=1 Tax=Eleusine coracana subsp. coracana TaxID=191504 RepID=A0AAV5CF46_ELECO|nr:hypothetical protein PR202_ga13538 [Eleusine coracana subsp. coracana]